MVMTRDRSAANTQLIPVQVESEYQSDYVATPRLIKRFSKTAVAQKLKPKVSCPTLVKYHRLAIAHIPLYRQPFEYTWGKEVRIDESAYIPETHILILQRIREEYIPKDGHRPTDEWIAEWLQHPDTQNELASLLDPMIALLYQD